MHQQLTLRFDCWIKLYRLNKLTKQLEKYKEAELKKARKMVAAALMTSSADNANEVAGVLMQKERIMKEKQKAERATAKAETQTNAATAEIVALQQQLHDRDVAVVCCYARLCITTAPTRRPRARRCSAGSHSGGRSQSRRSAPSRPASPRPASRSPRERAQSTAASRAHSSCHQTLNSDDAMANVARRPGSDPLANFQTMYIGRCRRQPAPG